MIEQYRNLSDPLSTWDITIWIICIVLLSIIAIFTLYRIYSKPKDITKLQKINAITWALAFILLIISIILCLIWKYLISDDLIALIVDNMVVSLINLGIIIKVIQIEFSINKYSFYKGYYFTFVTIGLFTFTMVFTPSIVREIGIFQIIYLILFASGIAIYPIIFLYMAIKLKGQERLMAIRIITGALLLGIGFLFQPQNMKDYKFVVPNFEIISTTFLILCPILVTIGTLLIFSSFKNNL